MPDPNQEAEMNTGSTEGTTEVAVARPAVSFKKKKEMRQTALWSALWECSQFSTTDELREFCERVLWEVDSDA